MVGPGAVVKRGPCCDCSDLCRAPVATAAWLGRPEARIAVRIASMTRATRWDNSALMRLHEREFRNPE
jgi:hypothetical protein